MTFCLKKTSSLTWLLRLNMMSPVLILVFSSVPHGFSWMCIVLSTLLVPLYFLYIHLFCLIKFCTFFRTLGDPFLTFRSKSYSCQELFLHSEHTIRAIIHCTLVLFFDYLLGWTVSILFLYPLYFQRHHYSAWQAVDLHWMVKSKNIKRVFGIFKSFEFMLETGLKICNF